MKVLIITPYFYESSRKEFTKNRTGYGILLHQIASYGSKLDDIFMLTTSITPTFEIGGFKVISHTWTDIIRNIKFRNIIIAIKNFIKIKQSLKNKLKYFFYSIDSGYTEEVIKKLKPDIVHFHTVGYRTEIGINICETINQKYLLTLHGLVGFAENTSPYLKESEKKLLVHAVKNNIVVTVISTGIKYRIETHYEIKDTDNILVVTNGTDTNQKKLDNYKDIRKMHGIPTNRKIMLCIGNISKNKNQEQLIRAYSILDPKVKENLNILILGNNDKSLGLDKLINNLKVNNNIKLCGFVNREDIMSYFNAADYNTIVSIDEGFGLSIIEAFTYGIPTVTFPDLDAVPDLYNENVMVLANSRSDIDLAYAIEKLYYTDWCNDFICEYSKNFSLEKMSEKYHHIYNKILYED